jgi:hypothetical protein
VSSIFWAATSTKSIFGVARLKYKIVGCHQLFPLNRYLFSTGTEGLSLLSSHLDDRLRELAYQRSGLCDIIAKESDMVRISIELLSLVDSVIENEIKPTKKYRSVGRVESMM